MVQKGNMFVVNVGDVHIHLSSICHMVIDECGRNGCEMEWS
jgi:hypothetical protein